SRAERIDEHGTLGLQPLVALDALLRVVLCLAFLERDLDAIDATISLVEEVEVVVEAVGVRNAAGGVWARAVHEQWDEDGIALLGERRRDCDANRYDERHDDESSTCHWSVLLVDG